MILDNNIEIFSSRDKIRNQIIEFAKEQLDLENFDFNKSSYLSYLINVLSGLTANSLYHNSSLWKQFFLVTADQKASVVNISAMLGYNPPLAIPSTASLLITIPINFMLNSNLVQFDMIGATDLQFRKPHQFYTDTVKFSLLNTLNIQINRSANTYTVYIKENYTHGDIITSDTSYSYLPYEIITYDSSGTKALRFIAIAKQIYTLDIDQTSFTIPDLKTYEFFVKDLEYKSGQVSKVDIITTNQKLNELLELSNINENVEPTAWREYNSIPLIPDDVNGYVTRTITKGLRIFFGNGIYGNQPTPGEVCSVQLNLCNGSKGNVIPGSIINADRILVQDGTQTKAVIPDVINPEPAYDGKDAPSIDEIRRNAITKVQTNNRLVTEIDYDNFSDVATELPIGTSTHVLKRSDLKRNEICLFTDLVYNDTVNNESYIVPTRNVLWVFDTSGGENLTIRTGDEITIDSEIYKSLFNIELIPQYLDTRYYYTADNLEVPINISRSPVKDTLLLPTHVKFYLSKATNPSNDKSYFELYYTKVIEGDLPDLVCNVEIPWTGEEYNMPHSVLNQKFYLNFEDYINLIDIPKGSHNFKFTITDVSNSSNHEIQSIGFVNTTLVTNLDEFMYSQIRYPNNTLDSSASSDIYWVYDVPVVLKDYYDRVDQDKFNFYVISKVIQFDVTKYRMLTDFVNFKFANTTGIMHNMKLNKPNRNPVIEANPCDLPVNHDHGDRYAISEEANENPWNRPGGFIAVASDYTPSGWLFEKLHVNDMFLIENTGKFGVYNGDTIIEPVSTIPVEVKAVVWMKEDYSGSDTALVEKIKKTLIETCYPKFGYQNKLYVSEITRIIKSVEGVENCRVLNPEHDIQFTYDYKDLTEEQLLTYTPELLFFDSSSIEIEMRI